MASYDKYADEDNAEKEPMELKEEKIEIVDYSNEVSVPGTFFIDLSFYINVNNFPIHDTGSTVTRELKPNTSVHSVTAVFL